MVRRLLKQSLEYGLLVCQGEDDEGFCNVVGMRHLGDGRQ